MLEVVEFTVEDVGFGRLLGDVPSERGRQVLMLLETGQELACLDQRLFVPAKNELRGHLCLAAAARSLTGWAPDHRRGNCSDQTKRQDRGAIAVTCSARFGADAIVIAPGYPGKIPARPSVWVLRTKREWGTAFFRAGTRLLGWQINPIGPDGRCLRRSDAGEEWGL